MHWSAALLVAVSLAPVVLCFVIVAFALALLLTLTGVGPLAQFLCSRADERLLSRSTAPDSGCVRLLDVGTPKGKRIAVRWSPCPNGSAYHPVVIPNGLGATLVTISSLHERLVALGFFVLSYDRLGVGMSDARPRGPPATAAEVVAEMHALLERLVPGGRWLIVGPSMGSIVAQAFIASHPSSVLGFLNVDGLPFPFAARRTRFEYAAMVYKAYAAIVWTGLLRPCFFAAGLAGSLDGLASAAFPVAVVKAQMNQRNFVASLAEEMITMMSCCDAATAGWGPVFNLAAMTKPQLAPLINTACVCGDAVFPGPGPNEWRWEDRPRAEAEVGGSKAEWTSVEEVTESTLQPMLARHAAWLREPSASSRPAGAGSLPNTWASLHVRAISARSYAFGFGPLVDKFYDFEMRDWGGAEHQMHVLLAARGGVRTAFPTRTHGSMFFGLVPFIADEVAALARAVAAAEAGAAKEMARD